MTNVLTQLGVHIALRALAKQAGAVSGDDATEWALNRGYMRRLGESTLVVTDSGKTAVRLWWRGRT